ncbi:hypothetical protein JCM3766R1_003205 [Sporobolomyces carnicolor]
MSSFSFPSARNGSRRPVPQRNNPARPHQASPYQRPGSSNAAGNNDDRWQHDLFGASSSLYQPAINVSHLSKIVPGASPSPSLRPFGDATPAPQRLISTTSTTNPAATATTSSNNDLIARIGIKGSSNQRVEDERAAKAERVRMERERREQLRVRKDLEREHEAKLQIAKAEETGFVVQVEGLVYGTSAEDVQTAFGSYGEIKHCFIENEKNSRDGDMLVARITFSRHEDAQTACHKLDGAIADGRPLKVRNVPRSPFPPALPPLSASLDALASSSSSSISVSVNTRGAASPAARGRGRNRMGPSTVPAQAAPPPPVAPIPSKMYADTIVEPVSSRAPTSTRRTDAMDVEMTAVPTGPRRGRPVAAAATPRLVERVVPPPPRAPSLLDRVNGNAGGARGVQGSGQQQPTLAQRLGQTTNARGRAANPRGNAAAAAGGGGSLLSRIV